MLGVAREDRDLPAFVGEEPDRSVERVPIHRFQRRPDVLDLDRGGSRDGVASGALADALSRGPQLPADRRLHRGAEVAEAVEAEARGEPHDRRAAGPSPRGEGRDRAERRGLGFAEHHLGDPALGGGQLIAALADARGDVGASR